MIFSACRVGCESIFCKKSFDSAPPGHKINDRSLIDPHAYYTVHIPVLSCVYYSSLLLLLLDRHVKSYQRNYKVLKCWCLLSSGLLVVDICYTLTENMATQKGKTNYEQLVANCAALAKNINSTCGKLVFRAFPFMGMFHLEGVLIPAAQFNNIFHLAAGLKHYILECLLIIHLWP